MAQRSASNPTNPESVCPQPEENLVTKPWKTSTSEPVLQGEVFHIAGKRGKGLAKRQFLNRNQQTCGNKIGCTAMGLVAFSEFPHPLRLRIGINCS